MRPLSGVCTWTEARFVLRVVSSYDVYDVYELVFPLVPVPVVGWWVFVAGPGSCRRRGRSLIVSLQAVIMESYVVALYFFCGVSLV